MSSTVRRMRDSVSRSRSGRPPSSRSRRSSDPFSTATGVRSSWPASRVNTRSRSMAASTRAASWSSASIIAASSASAVSRNGPRSTRTPPRALEVDLAQPPGEAHHRRQRPVRPPVGHEQQHVHQQQHHRQREQAEVEREVRDAVLVEHEVEAPPAALGDVHQPAPAVHGAPSEPRLEAREVVGNRRAAGRGEIAAQVGGVRQRLRGVGGREPPVVLGFEVEGAPGQQILDDDAGDVDADHRGEPDHRHLGREDAPEPRAQAPAVHRAPPEPSDAGASR